MLRRLCCQVYGFLGGELNCSTVGVLQPFTALNCSVVLGGAQYCSGASGYLHLVHPGLIFISVSSRKAQKVRGCERTGQSFLFLHCLFLFSVLYENGGSVFMIKCDFIFLCTVNVTMFCRHCFHLLPGLEEALGSWWRSKWFRYQESEEYCEWVGVHLLCIGRFPWADWCSSDLYQSWSCHANLGLSVCSVFANFPNPLT